MKTPPPPPPGLPPSRQHAKERVARRQAREKRSSTTLFGNFLDIVTNGWSNSFDYSGRSTRAEFWVFAIHVLLVGIFSSFFLGVASALDCLIFQACPEADIVNGQVVTIPVVGPLGFIPSMATALWVFYAMAAFIPGIAILFRRLRDAGKSPLSIFLLAIPLFGFFWFALILFSPSRDA